MPGEKIKPQVEAKREAQPDDQGNGMTPGEAEEIRRNSLARDDWREQP